MTNPLRTTPRSLRARVEERPPQRRLSGPRNRIGEACTGRSGASWHPPGRSHLHRDPGAKARGLHDRSKDLSCWSRWRMPDRPKFPFSGPACTLRVSRKRLTRHSAFWLVVVCYGTELQIHRYKAGRGRRNGVVGLPAEAGDIRVLWQDRCNRDSSISGQRAFRIPLLPRYWQQMGPQQQLERLTHR